MDGDTEGRHISHVVVDGVSPAESGERSVLGAPVLGRPVLAYVLDVACTVSDRVSVLVDATELEMVREGFEDRDLHWVPVDVSTEGRGEGVFNALASDSIRTGEGRILLVPGHLPLLSPTTLRALDQFHERQNADVSLLASYDEQQGEMVCRVQVGDPDGRGKAGDPNRGESVRTRTAAPVLLCERALLRQVLKSRQQVSDVAPVELIRSLSEGSRDVRILDAHDREDLLQVASAPDRAEAIRLLRSRVLDRLLEMEVEVLAPDLTYVEPEVEIGPGTVIEPFVVIRNGVEIGSNCHVGPFCQIREGTVLEDEVEIGNYVETKKTQVGQGSKAKHLSYLGDATLGSKVNIGAGTITANYDGTNKHRTVIEDGCSTGSNTVLVAPVRMENNSNTGAGAVVLQENHVREGDTVVGVPARSISEDA